MIVSNKVSRLKRATSSGGASLGPRGALAPLANENSRYMNSKMATVHYCSKRVAPLIYLKFKVKLRHCK